MKRSILPAFISMLSVISATAVAQTTTHAGIYAVQVNRTTNTEDSGFDRDPPGVRVPVTPGNQLVFSFWARNGQVPASTINRAALVFFTAGGAYINPPGDVNFEQNTSVPTPWTQYTQTAVTVPATAAQMNVSFRLNVNSSIVLDDVTVVDTTASNAQILPNGGFETWPTAGSPPTGWRFFGATDGSFVRLEDLPNSVTSDWQLY
jgi:hypothetical protein